MIREEMRREEDPDTTVPDAPKQLWKVLEPCAVRSGLPLDSGALPPTPKPPNPKQHAAPGWCARAGAQKLTVGFSGGQIRGRRSRPGRSSRSSTAGCLIRCVLSRVE